MVESHPHNNPAAGVSPSREAFVGRQREMGELRIALKDALSCQGYPAHDDQQESRIERNLPWDIPNMGADG